MKPINKKCRFILILALAAYIIKNIFVGADWDEGYGIVVGYRLAMGDRLLLEMWEPHQTSAIFTAFWIKLFISLTNSVDYLNLYLRVVYFLIHGSITYFVYRTLKKCICQEQGQEAFWLAIVYFVISPKGIYIPEYSNLHIWFFTILCMSILWYRHAVAYQENRLKFLLVAGLALTCDVMAYPSMVILTIPLLLLIAIRGKRKTDCLIFTIPCVSGFAVFACYLLSYMSPKQIIQALSYILQDGSHQITIWYKLSYIVSEFGHILWILLLISAVAAILTLLYCRLKKNSLFSMEIFLLISFILHVGYQFYCWFTNEFGAFYPHITHWFLLLSGIYCYYKNGKKEKDCLYLIWISITGFLGLLLLSNWGPIYLAPYLIVGVLGGLKCLGHWLNERRIFWKGTILPVLCGFLIFNNIFGYCWLYIGGEQNHSNLSTVSGLYKYGVRKGIFTAYIFAYCYNENQKIWEEEVPEGSNCLYIGANQRANQICYMMGNCRIAAASTISTPTYDERLLEYWKINPDRYPDVVVVESWFGEMEGAREGTFIREWLENEFQASEVTQYSYITIYKK